LGSPEKGPLKRVVLFCCSEKIKRKNYIKINNDKITKTGDEKMIAGLRKIYYTK